MELTGSTERATEPEAAIPVATPPAPRVRARRRGLLGSRRRQVVAGAIILSAIGWILYEGLANATQYFYTADQAVAQRARLGTQTFRIEGTVLDDVQRVGTTTRFNIYANGATVSIIDSGQPPQLFKPGIPVVLEGHWQGTVTTGGSPVYLANQIMVKHSASYTEAHPNRLKPQLPPSKSKAS